MDTSHLKDWHNAFKHPGDIFIQLTTACNARCINCPHSVMYGANGNHEKGVMTDDVWDKIILDIQTMGYRNQVGFYLHHEPFLSRTLFKKIRQINEETEAFAVISTNGFLLNEKNRKALIDVGPRIVHININSAEKIQYEEMTGLGFKTTIDNAKRFIAEAAGKVKVEINCPVMPGVDVTKLIQLFPNVHVNVEYWANSQGGLLKGITSKGRGSRFKISDYCLQPEQNFNILFDGSVILCCLDWAHESKRDFPNIMDQSIQEIYQGEMMKRVIEEFRIGDYNRYEMCRCCAVEMNFIGEDKNTERSTTLSKYQKPHQHDNKEKLNVLLATNHLFTYTGSETTLITIAKKLKEKGHMVSVYAKYIDPHFIHVFKEIAPVFDDISKLLGHQFDAAYIQHNPIALEVRCHYPNLPILFGSLGVLPFLEQPPFMDLDIYKYLAISEEVDDNLIHKGIDKSAIEIFRNIVDSKKFIPTRAINPKPLVAVVYSYKISPEKLNVVQKACETLNIQCRHIGEKPGVIDQDRVVEELNQADIVFTLGRGVIETMMCGKIPIVYDYQGGDGMVTPENIHDLMSHNFSGRRYRRDFNVTEMIEEIKSYNPDNAARLRELAIDYFDADKAVEQLISWLIDSTKNSIFSTTNEKKEKIQFLVELICVTKEYSLEAKRRALLYIQNSGINGHRNGSQCRELNVKEKIRHELRPSVSIKRESSFISPITIVITHVNRLETTTRCLDPLIENSPEKLYEIIIVDRASASGANEFLTSSKQNVSVIRNETNQGYIQACNLGIARAKGDYIVFLNNNIVVTRHWLEGLVSHFKKDSEVGMAGPMGNSISGPQSIQGVPYGKDMAAMHEFARDFSKRNSGKEMETVRLECSCLLVRKDVLNVTGGLDEKYSNWSFAIDDLCLRSSIAGYKNIIALDVFVHNNDMQDVKEIVSDMAMEENRKYFAEKWKDVIEYNSEGYAVNFSKEQQRNKLVEWGEDRISKGDVRGAAKIFERVYRFIKDDYKALNNLGVVQWQLGEAESAIKSFQSALSINPKYPDALSNLMNAAKESGRVDFIKPILQGILKQAQSAK